MYDLPTTVNIEGESFDIRNNADYRMILDCFNALNDEELTKQERIYACLIIFYADINCIEDLSKLPDINKAIEGMYRFFNFNEEETTQNQLKLIDWDKDSTMVCSAINKVAGKEVRAVDYMHWWTFMGYYMAVGESVLSTVVGIRHKILTGKKLEDYEKKFKRDNPSYFTWNSKTADQTEAENWVQNMWNGGD